MLKIHLATLQWCDVADCDYLSTRFDYVNINTVEVEGRLLLLLLLLLTSHDKLTFNYS